MVLMEPFIEYYQLNVREIGVLASVVVDKEDFDVICDEIHQHDPKILSPADGEPTVTKDAVTALKAACYIPLVKRGTKTQWLFDKYGIRESVSYMSMIVRGSSRQLVRYLQARCYQDN